MKYPGNINGPRFENGDLVTFIFDGAELTLRLPIIPNNPHNEDTISRTRDFRGIDTRNWNTNSRESPCIELASQQWTFEDASSLDDIALCRLYAGLVEVAPSECEKNILLRPEIFEETMLSWHASSFTSHEEMYLNDANWPALANRYHGKSIAKDHLNWFVVQLTLLSGSKPSQLVMIPINSRFVMMAYIELGSLHYDGRTNPYSNELLKKFEFDLFDNFLTHIDLRYSPELLDVIETLKETS